MLKAVTTDEDRSFKNFYRSLKNPYTRREYTKYLKLFLEFCSLQSYDSLLFGNDEQAIEDNIIEFLYQQGNNSRSDSFYEVFLSSLKHFYSMNNIELKWRKISKFIGETRPQKEDRPYSRQELQKMMEFANMREKVIISLCSSSGIRIGAIPDMKFGDLEPITIQEHSCDIYMVKVYARTKESYKTFCTPECRKYIDEYIDFRKRYGEVITKESPLIRQEFNTRNKESCQNAKAVTFHGVRCIIQRLIKKAGIHLTTEDVHETHGLRKYFDTTATNTGMFFLYVEKCMGHALPGMKGKYFKPTEYEILVGKNENRGYISAINDLTINDENRLKVKLQEKEQEISNYVKFYDKIMQKQQDMERQFEEFRKRQ